MERSIIARTFKSRPSSLSIHTKRPSRPQDSQTPGHANAISKNIQLAPLHFPPTHRNLSHGDPGKLSQHEHLNIEDPAFGVHVWHDIGKCRTRKKLEAALRILNRSSLRRRHQPKDQVEGM